MGESIHFFRILLEIIREIDLRRTFEFIKFNFAYGMQHSATIFQSILHSILIFSYEKHKSIGG